MSTEQAAHSREQAEGNMPYQTREEMLQHTINRLSHRIEERDQRIVTLEAEKAELEKRPTVQAHNLALDTIDRLQVERYKLQADNWELRKKLDAHGK